VTAASKYPKQVFWSDEDEGFVAIAPDLPGCSAFGNTEIDAIAELDNAIPAWIDAAINAGNKVPTPSNPAQHNYSGKLLVRMPRSLHQELANTAQKESVSLNQFIVYILSMYSSLRVSQIGSAKTLDDRTSLSLIPNNISFTTTAVLYTTGSNTLGAAGYFSSSTIQNHYMQHIEPTIWDVELEKILEKSVIMSNALANSPIMLVTIPNRTNGE
jgi:predicted RNase H-like HicB family nuclease